METKKINPNYIEVIYFVESEFSLEKTAEDIARGQTFSTWVKVGKETDRIKKEFGGKVIEVKADGSKGNGKTQSGTIKIAFPWRNFGPKIPNLISNLFGEMFEIKEYKKLKVLDIIMPDKYIDHFRGPLFGIENTKKLIRYEQDRPLIGAIFKPCLGLNNSEIAKFAYDVAMGGVDFIKDDEVVGDNYFSNVEDRVKQVMRSLKKAYDKTGRKVLYAVSITDRVDMLKPLHDVVMEEKGNCIMVNVSAIGLSALRVLSEKTKFPIHCHRVFTPAYTRCDTWGISMKVFMKLCRLAGGDHIHCGSIAGKFYETDEEVIANAAVCTEDMGHLMKSLPVTSGKQWAGTVEASYKAFGGKNNYLHLFGGGVFGHPKGAEAGAKSIVQAYEAAVKGVKVGDYAKAHEELDQALKHFGNKEVEETRK